MLDDVERERAARFVFDVHRRRYINAHACLRFVLGRCLGVSPASLRFASTPDGKPHIVDRDAHLDLRFNMAHSGELALIAVTVGREVGVDVEEEKSLDDLMALAGGLFTAAEVGALMALPASARPSAFFRCWTQKEALVKAVGKGLRYPLDQFEVSLDAAVSHTASPVFLDGVAWRPVSIPMNPPYTAALAAEAGDWRVRVWRAPAEIPRDVLTRN